MSNVTTGRLRSRSNIPSSEDAGVLNHSAPIQRGPIYDSFPPLPDKPISTFRPNNSWVALNLREVWVYRELFYFLIWRDVKVRYKQTLLGATWAILQPLCTMIIFSLLFGKLAGIPSDGIPYPIFAYVGIFAWLFLSSSLMNCINSLVANSNLITKVYFPRILIPGAAVIAGLVEFGIAFLALIGLMVYYHIGPSWNLALLPVFLLLIVLLTMSIGIWISALNVRYRDVRLMLPFIIQLWFFSSPIIYPPSFLPKNWGWLLVINPLTGIIEGFRSSLLGRPFNWAALSLSSIITLFILICSTYMFRRLERSFADVI